MITRFLTVSNLFWAINAAREVSGERRLTAAAPRTGSLGAQFGACTIALQKDEKLPVAYSTISGRRLLPVRGCGFSLHNLRTNHVCGLCAEVNCLRPWTGQVRELFTDTTNAATAARPVGWMFHGTSRGCCEGRLPAIARTLGRGRDNSGPRLGHCSVTD